MKRYIVLLAILSLALVARGQGVTSSQDYILTTTFNSTGGTSPVYDVEYFDNLGYPIQRVSVAASPNGRSIVTPVYYDALRRENQQYLPYVASVTTGAYVAPTTAVSNQKSFYNSKFSGNNGYSYTEDVYEASPLDRVTIKWNVGNVYRANSKKTMFAYAKNTSSEVVKFTATRSSTSLTRSGYHALGTLFKTTETNEDKALTISFTDVEGKVVLERRVNGSENLDTYYVYDEVGNLAYVLPPELSPKITASISDTNTNTDMANYAYIYMYNTARNTLKSKKLPGADWVYMVYDKGDRPVMMQDGNMRSSNRWLYTEYDNLNRPLSQKLITGVITHSTIQSNFDTAPGRYDPLGYNFTLVETLSESKYDEYNN